MQRRLAAGQAVSASVFVFDRLARTTSPVPVPPPAIVSTVTTRTIALSGDGTVLAVAARSAGCAQNEMARIFVRDLAWQRTTELLRDRFPCAGLDVWDVSRDGRFVSFLSRSPSLVPGDADAFLDPFVTDRFTGALVRATGGGAPAAADSFGAAMNADASRVVFRSSPALLPGGGNGTFAHYVLFLDGDGDGMHDAWEAFAGVSYANGGDAAADPDRDGRHNLDEFRAGTHPRVPLRLRTRGAAVDPESSRVLIRNRGRNAAQIWLRAVDAAGRSFPAAMTVAPGHVLIVPVAALANRPSTAFSIEIESTEPLAAGLSR